MLGFSLMRLPLYCTILTVPTRLFSFFYIFLINTSLKCISWPRPCARLCMDVLAVRVFLVCSYICLSEFPKRRVFKLRIFDCCFSLTDRTMTDDHEFES